MEKGTFTGAFGGEDPNRLSRVGSGIKTDQVSILIFFFLLDSNQIFFHHISLVVGITDICPIVYMCSSALVFLFLQIYIL